MKNKFSIRSDKTDAQIKEEKYKHTLDQMAKWTSFYRANPHRFAKDFMNINLKKYQVVELKEMMDNNTIVLIGSRGIAKTFMTALFCVIRCILYPKTRICVVSKTLQQAIEVLKKITELFIPNSNLLRNEILADKSNGKDPQIIFKNGSIIFAKPCTDNARGVRSYINIYDEYVFMNLDIVDRVHNKFITSARNPKYLEKPEYADYPREENKRIYMSSPLFKDTKPYYIQVDAFKKMLEGKKAFTFSIPYQCGIAENVISKQTVLDEIESSDYDSISFSQEYEAKWFGGSGESFFSLSDLTKARKIKKSLPPIERVLESKETIPSVDFRCKRILSVDVALMGSSKKRDNDASSFIINDARIGSDNRFIGNIVYTMNYEGLTSDDLVLQIMRHFYKYKCTDLVIDSNGLGLSIFDGLLKDVVDPDTNEIYKALTCINDKEMAKRCKIHDAKKVIWSIKASAKFNSLIAKTLRSSIRDGYVKLLISEYEAEDNLEEDNKYKNMSLSNQLKYKMPYIGTTLLINELVKLNYEVNGSDIKVKERSGMRKDRYSSLAYNIYVMKELEKDNVSIDTDTSSFLNFSRKPKIKKSFLYK